MPNSDATDRLRAVLAAEGGLILGDDRPEWQPGDDQEDLADRVVPAADLRKLLLDHEGSEPFNVVGAFVADILDIQYLHLPFPIAFVDCVFDSPLEAVQAGLPSLLLRHCAIFGDRDQVSLAADRILLDGNLELSHTATSGTVRVAGAKIGGQMIFPGLRVQGQNDDEVSLFASGIAVADSLWAHEGLELSGAADLSRARVVGDMHLSNAKLNTARRAGRSLDAHALQVEGTLHLDGVEAHEKLILGGRVAGDLILASSTIQSTGDSIAGRDLEVLGSAYFHKCDFSGPVSLSRCSLAKDLIFADGGVGRAGLTHTGAAVDLQGTTVGGSLRFLDGWRSGTIDLSNARVGESLVVSGTHLGATADRGGEQAHASIFAHRLFVAGDIGIGERTELEGHLMAMGLRVGGSFFLADCRVLGVNGTGASVICDRAEFAGSFRIEGSTLKGALRTPSVRVGSQFRVDLDVGSVDDDSCIVAAHGASVSGRGRFFLRCRTSAAVVDIGGSRWERGLHVAVEHSVDSTSSAPDLEATDAKPDDYGLQAISEEPATPRMKSVSGTLVEIDAEEVAVVGEVVIALELAFPDDWSAVAFTCDPFSVVLRNASISGRLAVGGFPIMLDLSACTVGILELPDDVERMPALRAAEGWTVGALAGSVANDRRLMSRWLRRYYHSGRTWYQIASIFESRGALEDGRRLRYEATLQRLKEAPLHRRIVGLVSRTVTGHGYYPLRSLLWLILICCLAAGLCTLARESFVTPVTPTIRDVELASPTAGHPGGMISASKCTPEWDVPCLSPVAYALDSTVPGSAGSQDQWEPSDSWLVFALAALRTAAWVLTALFLAGITGLLRKRE